LIGHLFNIEQMRTVASGALPAGVKGAAAAVGDFHPLCGSFPNPGQAGSCCGAVRRTRTRLPSDTRDMVNITPTERREDVNFRVLRLLAAHPEYSQREIAQALGVSLGGVNFCLQALIAKGLVKVENFKASPHKRGYCHVLTPQGLGERAALTGSFLMRKRAEYDALTAEIAALQAEIAADPAAFDGAALGEECPS
jgi:EPS-associated MarR family transcriptional regulator